MSRWLVTPFPRPDAAVRLFCFPYAGGGASVYRAWGCELPPSIEVTAVQLPGREERVAEPPLSDLRTIARSAADAIAPRIEAGEGYALFGHSMGALLAFEVARVLRARKLRPPRALVLSAHAAPHLTPQRERICDLPDTQFIERLVAMEGTPRALFDEPELRDFFLPILRADFTACDRYELDGGSPLAVPFVLLAGERDATMPPADVGEWARHTTGRTTLRLFSGGHFFLNHERPALLAAVAAAVLDQPINEGDHPSCPTPPPPPSGTPATGPKRCSSP